MYVSRVIMIEIRKSEMPLLEWLYGNCAGVRAHSLLTWSAVVILRLYHHSVKITGPLAVSALHSSLELILSSQNIRPIFLLALRVHQIQSFISWSRTLFIKMWISCVLELLSVHSHETKPYLKKKVFLESSSPSWTSYQLQKLLNICLKNVHNSGFVRP
jgi:hypothetical protein